MLSVRRLETGPLSAAESAAGGLVRRPAESDARWPALAAALQQLRLAKRRSVRIVDADCGAGGLLIHAVRHARALGFTAIEGRGIDGVPALIARARVEATTLRDPAIGLVFETADVRAALAEECDFPADIILCHGADAGASSAAAVAAAGQVVIGGHHGRIIHRHSREGRNL